MSLVISNSSYSLSATHMGTDTIEPAYEFNLDGSHYVASCDLSALQNRSITVGEVVDAILCDCNGEGIPFTGRDLENIVMACVSSMDNDDLMRSYDDGSQIYIAIEWC